MPGFSTKVDSNITRPRIRVWMNGPGAPVWNWRETTMRLAFSNALALAPVNNPKNAAHRGGAVGTYKASMRFERTGNQRGRGFAISNTAGHAEIVEFGRSRSVKDQYFGWVKDPSSPRWYGRTQGRDGQHVVERATKAAVGVTT